MKRSALDLKDFKETPDKKMRKRTDIFKEGLLKPREECVMKEKKQGFLGERESSIGDFKEGRNKRI